MLVIQAISQGGVVYYKIVALESELRSYLHLKLSRPQYMLSLLCYNNRYVFN